MAEVSLAPRVFSDAIFLVQLGKGAFCTIEGLYDVFKKMMACNDTT